MFNGVSEEQEVCSNPQSFGKGSRCCLLLVIRGSAGNQTKNNTYKERQHAEQKKMRSIFVLKSGLSERGNDVRTCMLTRICV